VSRAAAAADAAGAAGGPAGAAEGGPTRAGAAGTAGALGGLRDALRAEWTKLRTVSGTGWLLATIVVATVGVSVGAVVGPRCPPGPIAACPPVDTAKLAFTGGDLGQAIVAILAVMALSGEFSTGMIRVTFAAMPRRLTVLAAKAGILTGLVLVAGAVAAAGSLLAGRLILPGHGFTAARGFTALSLANGPVLRATVGSVLYLALIGLLSLGVAALVREAAVAIGVVLGLLYLFPIIATVVASDPSWQRHLEQIGPMQAGLAIEATTGLHSLPISPWAGLGVLAAWAAAALLAGGLLLGRRDA
jgi:ABC-2 type transport system permease protein